MKNFFMLFFTLLTFNTEASVLCHTPRMNKIFDVSENKVTFFNEFDSQAKREIASVFSRSKSNDMGVTKIVDFENQKHTIHIADMNHFSDINDYIIIKSRTGHEVIYPLSCENK